MKTIDYAMMGITDAKEIYPVLWNTFKKAFPDVPDKGIATMVSITTDTCRDCHQENSTCRCGDDE